MNTPTPQGAQSQGEIRAIVVSREDANHSLVHGFLEKQQVQSDNVAVGTLAEAVELKVTPRDVLIVDIDDLFDLKVLRQPQIAEMVRRAYAIFLCGSQQADACKRLVLNEVISDYFVVRPTLDTSYLEVQIWRALRQVSGKARPAFRVELEITDSNENELADNAAVKSRKRVLIVEDDMMSLTMLRDMLFLDGFDVRSASNVVNACAKYRDEEFDVWLVDLMAREYGGTSWLGRMIDSMPNRANIIVFSSSTNAVIVKDCAQLGVSAYLVKPIHREKLLDRVHGMVG